VGGKYAKQYEPGELVLTGPGYSKALPMAVMNNNLEFYERVFQQFMDLFVKPAISERQAKGELQRPLPLNAAQIIYFPDGRRPLVRINSEIRAISEVKLKKGIGKKSGEPVYENEIEGLESIKLADQDDIDCGHATLIRLNDTWTIAFDFTYNKGLAKKHIETAVQFLEVAETAHARRHWSPFVDNLFSAAELAARAILLAVPEKHFREKPTHKGIHSRFNRFANVGNAKREHRAAFNKLSSLRGRARYLKGELLLNEADATTLLLSIKEMINFASQ